jgi:hypothetical protein
MGDRDPGAGFLADCPARLTVELLTDSGPRSCSTALTPPGGIGMLGRAFHDTHVSKCSRRFVRTDDGQQSPKG